MSKQGLIQKEKWTLKDKFSKSYLKGLDFSDLEKQLLFTRGIQDVKEAEEFLSPKYESLHDPFLLKGVKEAVERIKKAVQDKEKAVIYGDYDVDGITATAILYETLGQLGIETDYYIPKRNVEGYGLNKDALDEIAKKGAKLVITVDCGVTAVDEVEYAKKLGLDIIVTDHHATQIKHQKNNEEILPDTIVVNPKQKACNYPYKELSGSGIAFKMAQALYKEFPEKLTGGQEKWLLDLVALGTICDVVPLTGENRILAHFGLKVIQKTKRIGIKLLAEVSRTQLSEIDSYKIGFQLGPRLNAAGRLETAEKSIQILLTKDENEARMLALELNKLNMDRQDLTQRILKEAILEVEKKSEKAKIYLLKGENWPSGVVGIVASKLAERYFKPVIVCEDKGDECQGSARSPKCFNIIEALEKSSEFLVRYGGHSRAAGITVKKEHFVLLENKLLELSDSQIQEEDLVSEYKIDSESHLSSVSADTYDFLKKLEPFGMGNPMPVFISTGIKVDSFKKVGKEFEHLKLVFSDTKAKVNGIYFSFTGDGLDFTKNVDVLYQVTENEWGGRKSYEMRCIGLRESA
ncbi:single-stranded-DNA-specific exonuclease RecJ [candidate division WS5 bacterium]|uniref:Single-stranded-DNA-specific exonuclease RecJ n=1 Tax=candidate division WS5 bacterium TaxID=2093353 RepID=A0A419DF70_9BACT|nr:MAG: single-stranded-DNA-specific exonuclease RecJ [candidate division WS5 bacterium]